MLEAAEMLVCECSSDIKLFQGFLVFIKWYMDGQRNDKSQFLVYYFKKSSLVMMEVEEGALLEHLFLQKHLTAL